MTPHFSHNRGRYDLLNLSKGALLALHHLALAQALVGGWVDVVVVEGSREREAVKDFVHDG